MVYYTLYNKKTNQPVKDYVVYNHTLYYDAIEKMGRHLYKGIPDYNGQRDSGVQQSIRYHNRLTLTGIHKESGKYFVDGLAANGTYNGIIYKNGYAK